MGLDSFKHTSQTQSYNNSVVKYEDGMDDESKEKGYIRGVLLGDASLYERGSKDRWRLSLDTVDKEFAIQFGVMLCEWTGLEWDGWDSEDTEVSCVGPRPQEGNAQDQWRIDKSVTKISNILHDFQDVEIEKVMGKSSVYKQYLLKGLWDSEGCIERDGAVTFTSTDSDILWLYMELLSKLLGVKLSQDWEWASRNKSGRKYGEFTVSALNDFNARRVSISNKYTEDFYNLVDPTIKRKREVFEEYLY